METTFWILSKLLWDLLAPEKVVLFLLVLGAILIWTRRSEAGRWLISLGTILLLIPVVFPLNNFLLKPLEERFPVPAELPETIDGIIVLGGSERSVITSTRGQPSLNQAGERLTTFIALARRYPQARLVYAGGAGSLYKQNYKSNETARQLFLQLGLNPDHVLFDEKARNTAENAANILNLIEQKPEGNWILITSAFHIPRAVGIFRKLGWNVIAYPVDYQTSGQLKLDWKVASLHNFLEFSRGLHEWTGLFAYWMTGKTLELFPKPAV
ncbi:MAG: hypothetical protein NPINA01_31770 [Nitrospinaceae bacterium]|nr:MAG: hypothetical protein NPINA01_31770 [Nitrospinaceae bacterium]